MVVIEAEEEVVEEKPRVTHPKPNPSSSSDGGGGEVSDGYETASDTELNEHLNDHTTTTTTNNNNNDTVVEASPIDYQKALDEANVAKLEGNKLFGAGHYEEALSKYESALQVAPDVPLSIELRSICHANCAICFLKLTKYDDAVKECTKALELNPNYLKALLRRAEAHEKLEHYEEAIADMKKVLELDASEVHARRTIHRLEPLAAEKREKMKEEMIGKLKEMGNSVLGRFGMSVDNFKAVKDPNTGSYSISFQK